MEEIKVLTIMLDLMPQPAFFVQDDKIAYANESARQYGIAEGTAIESLLETGKADYAELEQGTLHLTLCTPEQQHSASVRKLLGGAVFMLENDSAQPELQTLAVAAQDLRAPLSTVMTAVDLMAAQKDDSAKADHISHARHGLFQLLRRIGNMSDANSYIADPLPPGEIRDACAVFQEIFEKAESYLQSAQIKVSFQNLSTPVMTAVDADKLERAVYNLLSNSAKYTPKGGTISAVLTRKGGYLYLTIQDSGCGIEPEVRGTVFSRYRRQPGIEDGRRGIGLGLSLVRAVAAQHGGTVLIEQAESIGTRVTLSMKINASVGALRSPILTLDYAGEWNHGLVELSDALPSSFYKKDT